MSINGFSSDQNNKKYKNPSHWRNNSGELDVFEASKYFSSVGSDQNPGLNFSSNRQNIIPTRMSLDMPITRHPIIPPDFHHVGPDHQKQPKLENKKHKEPSSPGGRLASFLNSLFNQTSLKKKKSKPAKDFDDENAPGRRKRRSSVSHFRIITNGAANSTVGDNSRSGFRTPPPYADTPNKSYKAIPLFPSGKGGILKTTLKDELCAEKKEDEKSRATGKNNSKNLDFRFIDGFRRFDDDDGADSDSSSDLFDLPSHELDFYSSGLPVYETTHMDSIKLVQPISRATTV